MKKRDLTSHLAFRVLCSLDLALYVWHDKSNSSWCDGRSLFSSVAYAAGEDDETSEAIMGRVGDEASSITFQLCH